MTQVCTEDFTVGQGCIGLNPMDAWVHIVGGGLSGLSLASSLARHQVLPGPVLISEPEPERLTQKTFSFWLTDEEHAFLKPQYTQAKWQVSTEEITISQIGQRFRYGTRSGQHVLDECQSLIACHPQIHQVKEVINEIPKAKHVFDSRPIAPSSFRMIQSFSGTEVEFQRPHQIEAVGLMNRIEATDSGIRFVYVLPLGTKRVLIEHTEFTTKLADLVALQSMNRDYLSREFSTNPFRTIRTESAHIPMGFRSKASHLGIPIGARGGMTRDATGYGYRTIRYACEAMARDLITNNQTTRYDPSLTTQWADTVFLNLIDQRPDSIPEILLTIARRMTADQFAGFMMMRTPSDVFRILWSAPLRPFTCALIGKYQWI